MASDLSGDDDGSRAAAGAGVAGLWRLRRPRGALVVRTRSFRVGLAPEALPTSAWCGPTSGRRPGTPSPRVHARELAQRTRQVGTSYPAGTGPRDQTGEPGGRTSVTRPEGDGR